MSCAAMPLLGARREHERPSHSTALASLDAEPKMYWSQVPLIGLTTAINVLATGIACVGLLHVPVSIWQMLGGAMIVFAAFFSRTCMGRRLQFSHWIGISTCALGIVLVCEAAILNSCTLDV